LKEEEKNPLYTTTFGVGEMIKDACERGCRRFYIGIGGSATNDGGIGMLSALGYSFLDAEGKNIDCTAAGLKDLKKIATSVICERFDHAFIYNAESVGEKEIAGVVEKYGMRTVALPFRSTAENMAAYFFKDLKEKLPHLVAVKVWETADSSAEYREK
jgi:glycerate kinase